MKLDKFLISLCKCEKNMAMKYFLFIFSVISFQANAQWQVIDDTDSIPVKSVHVQGDYLFATLSYSSLSGPVVNGFRRYSLTNPYQMQAIVDSLGVPFGAGVVENLGEYDGGLLATHHILSTGYSNVMTSSDNGLTWDESYSLSSNYIPVRVLGSGVDLYIGANKTIYHSQDLNQPFNFLFYESYYINTTMKPLRIHNGDGYFSEAAGLIRNNAVIDPLELSCMTVIGNDFYGFSDYDDFFKSTDLGDTWTLQASHPFNYINVLKLENFNGILYACTEKGVFVSVDQGINWYDINDGLPKYNGVNYPVYDIAYYNGDLFLATMLGAFVISESEIVLSLGTHLNESSKINKFVYPNPTDENVFVQGKSFNNLEVTDELGRTISYSFTQNEKGIEITVNDFHGICYISYRNEQELLCTHRVLFH